MLFFSEREYGHEVFIQCFDALHSIPKKQRFRKVAKWLDLSEQTLRKYYRGDLSPPRAVTYALWHECQIGMNWMRQHYGNDLNFTLEHVRVLKDHAARQSAEINKLRALIGTAGAANDAWVTNNCAN